MPAVRWNSVWEARQGERRSVPGIHFKVKQDFQAVQDGIVDVVGFVNDNDRGLPLFKGKAGDFFLNGSEIIGFAEGRLCAQLLRQISVEIVCRQCGKTGIDYLVKGRVQSGSPCADDGCLAASGAAGQKAEPLCFSQIIQPEEGLLRSFVSTKISWNSLKMD